MKKLMITSLLTAAAMLAQTSGTAPAQSGPADQGATGKTKHTRTRRHHKKNKAATTDTTTTTPAPATK